MNRTAFIDYHLPATATTEEMEGNQNWLWSLAAIGDGLITFLALSIAFVIRFNFMPSAEDGIVLWNYKFHLLFGIATLIAIQFSRGLYQKYGLLNRKRNIFRSFVSAIIWLPIFLGGSLILDLQPEISRLFSLIAGAILGISLPLWRIGLNYAFKHDDALDKIRMNTLIIGWNKQLDDIYAHSLKNSDCPFKITACVPDNNDKFSKEPPAGLNRLSSFAQVENTLQSGRFNTVIVSDLQMSPEQLIELNRICGREMVELMILPNFINVFLSNLNIHTVGNVPLMSTDQSPLKQPANRLLKRAFDIIGGIAGLILSAPIIAVFCYMVYRESPGPVFYKQLRVGKGGRLFDIIKIRSMRINAEKERAGFSTADDPRRLKIGELMRRLNIDEMPQFWNVITGDMSLVGPRPERPELIKNFKDEIKFYNLRHAVKPGITGWAQVNGWRGDTDLSKRIEHDLDYMEKWTLLLDIYIMLKTPFAHKNAY